MSVRQDGQGIERLLAEIRAIAPRPTVAQVEELVRRLLDLYGEGLARIVDILGTDDADLAVVRTRVLRDTVVSGLLLLHDLHPIPLEERVAQALQSLQPYLDAHAGRIDLLAIGDEGIVRLRLKGRCNSCPTSLITVKMALEQAMEEMAPDITGIEVEGMPAEVESAAAPDGKR